MFNVTALFGENWHKTPVFQYIKVYFRISYSFQCWLVGKSRDDPVWSPGLYGLSLGPSALSRLSKSQYSERTHAGSLSGVSYKLTACKTTIEFQRPSSRQETKMLFLAIPCEELGRSCTKEEPTQPSAWCSAWIGSIFFIVEKSSDLYCQAVWQKLCKGKGVLLEQHGLGVLVNYWGTEIN